MKLHQLHTTRDRRKAARVGHVIRLLSAERWGGKYDVTNGSSDEGRTYDVLVTREAGIVLDDLRDFETWTEACLKYESQYDIGRTL